MGAFKEQAKGAAQRVKGKVKEEAGEASGDKRMEVEGRIEKNVGRLRQKAARPMEAMKGSAREMKGNAKRAAGEVAGDPDLAAEGEAERVQGRVRRKLNE